MAWARVMRQFACGTTEEWRGNGPGATLPDLPTGWRRVTATVLHCAACRRRAWMATDYAQGWHAAWADRQAHRAPPLDGASPAWWDGYTASQAADPARPWPPLDPDG